MGYFAQLGKPLVNGQVSLTNASPSQAVITALAAEWIDLYTIHITSNDTAAQSVVVTDGTTTLTYFTGGASGGNNFPIFDQGTVPVRFTKGATLTVTASPVTAGKTVQVNVRGLFNNT